MHRSTPVSLPRAGGWPFLITSFLGRLPASMVQLGYLMVLSSSGRGLAAAGLAVAAVGLGTAIGAPVIGRLVDRFGALRVLSVSTAGSLLGQLAFLAALVRQEPTTTLLVCAGLVGFANPQIGAVARTHWSHLAHQLRQPGLVSRALGYEGAVDELGFVIGPVLAGALVGLAGPVPATVVVLVATGVLQGLFLVHLWAHRGARAAEHTAAPAPQAAGGLKVDVLWPLLGCLGVGLLFGSTQTALTGLFELRGTPGLTGVVYGCVGVGSGIASLLVGRLPASIPVPRRVAFGAGLALLGALLMMGLPSALPASLVGILLGSSAGVVLVSSFGWMERIAPRHRMATMMTVLMTAVTLGISGGAALAGSLAAEPARAFWPLFATAGLALVAALGMRLSRWPSE